MNRNDLIQNMKREATGLRTNLVTTLVCVVHDDDLPEYIEPFAEATADINEHLTKISEDLNSPTDRLCEELAKALRTTCLLVNANLDQLSDDELLHRAEVVRQLSRSTHELMIGTAMTHEVLEQRKLLPINFSYVQQAML